MIFSIPKGQIKQLVHGLRQSGTGSIPTRFSMKPEYRLSESYAEMARIMGMKKANGTEISGYSSSERRLALEYK